MPIKTIDDSLSLYDYVLIEFKNRCSESGKSARGRRDLIGKILDELGADACVEERKEIISLLIEATRRKKAGKGKLSITCLTMMAAFVLSGVSTIMSYTIEKALGLEYSEYSLFIMLLLVVCVGALVGIINFIYHDVVNCFRGGLDKFEEALYDYQMILSIGVDKSSGHGTDLPNEGVQGV